jgi:hypothetical protein
MTSSQKMMQQNRFVAKNSAMLMKQNRPMAKEREADAIIPASCKFQKQHCIRQHDYKKRAKNTEL